MLSRKQIAVALSATLVLILTTSLLIACTTAPAETVQTEEAGHEEGEEHGHEEGGEHERIPNNGAVITIVSPADGATFSSGEDITVEVSVESFDVNDPGNHWHVYLDGVTQGMIVISDRDFVLHGLEHGKHEISVYLSDATHQELEDGAAIHINVSE